MKHFGKYVFVFLGTVSLLLLSGCGVREDPLTPVTYSQIGIRIRSGTNDNFNWQSTPFAQHNMENADLYAWLRNENLFSPLSRVSGRFVSTGTFGDEYLGNINFDRRRFVLNINPEEQYYLGLVEVKTRFWMTHDGEGIFSEIPIAQSNEVDTVFSPGTWHDVAFTFYRSESAVNFVIPIGEIHISGANPSFTYEN